jgi:hypothetical protein
MSVDERNRFKEDVHTIWNNVNLTGEQKRLALSALSARFNKSVFVNIIEEPEQNLFPTSQWKMLQSLLEFNAMNEGKEILPVNSCTDDVSIYEMDNKGFLNILSDYNGIPSDDNFLNNMFVSVQQTNTISISLN